jgi:hypothetical protein
MNNKLKTVGLSLAGVSLLATGIVALAAQAAEPSDNSERNERSEHRGERGDHKESFAEVKEAIENNDYAAWAEAMSQHPKAEEFVTEDNFNTLVQAHDLMEAGDKEGAKALLEEAGIKRPGKHRDERGERFQAVRSAIESGDYQAWADAMAEHPNADIEINEATFATLQEAHTLMEAGDKEGAKALLEEAGIKHSGKFKGHGQRGGQGSQEQA